MTTSMRLACFAAFFGGDEKLAAVLLDCMAETAPSSRPEARASGCGVAQTPVGQL
jgi:hypothetical protein